MDACKGLGFGVGFVRDQGRTVRRMVQDFLAKQNVGCNAGAVRIATPLTKSRTAGFEYITVRSMVDFGSSDDTSLS